MYGVLDVHSSVQHAFLIVDFRRPLLRTSDEL